MNNNDPGEYRPVVGKNLANLMAVIFSVTAVLIAISSSVAQALGRISETTESWLWVAAAMLVLAALFITYVRRGG